MGDEGAGTLNITNGGLVEVNGMLAIDYDTVFSADPIIDSCINMSTGGMLALYGDADDSLLDFLSLVEGTDAINYWDAGLSGWDALSNATWGADYTLALGQGNLAGYTVLTVGTYTLPVTVPVPSSLLLASSGLALSNYLRRKRSVQSNPGLG